MSKSDQALIPKGWKKISLGAALRYEQPFKYTVKSTEYNEKSGTPVLTAGKSFILGYTNETDSIYLDHPVIIFDDFTTDSRLVDFPFKVKSSAMKFLKERNKDETNLEFLFAILQSLKLTTTGGDHKRRWISEFSRIEVYVPGFHEQNEIATILSVVEDSIKQTENLIAKYKRIQTGLMQELLTKGIDTKGNIRSKGTHKFVLKKGLEVPEDWDVSELGSLSQVTSGITLGKKYEGNSTIELPYLRVANVQDGYLDLDEISTIRIPNDQVSKYTLEIGDVLMNEGGDFDKLGRGTLWRGQLPICLHQNHVFKVRTYRQKLHPEFLEIVSRSAYGRKFFILSSKQSTNLASINSTQLKAFPIPLPDPSEQLRIILIHKAVQGKIDSLTANLKKLHSLKTGLIQDLLSGKVRVFNR